MSKHSPIIGAHLSVAGGYYKAYEEAARIGASCLQLFAKSPMQSRLRTITDEEAAAIKEANKNGHVKAATIHASYLLNFAKPLADDAYQIKSLVEDVENAAKIGALGAVVHMGKILELDPAEAEKLFIQNIETVLEKTKGLHAKVILENTAGQGSEMGYRLDEYGKIFHTLAKNHSRIGSCMDTAHLFAGGYDLADPARAADAVREIDDNVGIAHITCVHLNDSKKPLGSRVDRHQDLNHGTIKSPGLKAFAKALYKERKDIPFILETPQEHAPFEDQIKEFNSWFT